MRLRRISPSTLLTSQYPFIELAEVQINTGVRGDNKQNFYPLHIFIDSKNINELSAKKNNAGKIS